MFGNKRFVFVTERKMSELKTPAFNPSTPMAYQERISPYESIQYQADKWWEKNTNVNEGISSWSNTKLSELTS